MNKVCRLLEDYLKNDLTPEEKDLFDKHLNECENCRREVELLREVEGYLNSIPKVKVPEDFSERVIEKVYEHKRKVAGWYMYAAVFFVSFISAFLAINVIGINKAIQNVVSVGESVYKFAKSVLTAITTLSGTLYSVMTPGKINSVVLTIAFGVILLIFLKSIKLFSSVER
ncbi:anti-sigma factor family protein [Thermotomaculum hydrothermale]|uniref:anti-sigma factor family protein n=1 Tax=Thermotomaculum hydrothermale TaxID=981385 RepID=UPI0019162E97|nr:zf-HC2 domain-containing protein [Thermotomaculum hydrothermale]